MRKLEWRLAAGKGRTMVTLTAGRIGNGLAVFLFNDAAHIGAVAVSQFDHAENRASTSVITLLGHKDDAVAYQAAHEICRAAKIPVSVTAGIHLDDITLEEIKGIKENSDKVIKEFIGRIGSSIVPLIKGD